MDKRFDARFTQIDNRLEKLNQNYIDHLAFHVDNK